jgi:hypothetical protein
MLTREFSSADNVMSLVGTVGLLKRHRLMVGTADQASQGELLR